MIISTCYIKGLRVFFRESIRMDDVKVKIEVVDEVVKTEPIEDSVASDSFASIKEEPTCSSLFQTGDDTKNITISPQYAMCVRFPCFLCNVIFLSESDYDIHTQTTHPQERTQKQPYFVCGICGGEFSTETQFLRHMGTHMGEKPFECATCNASYTEEWEYEEHVKTHQVVVPVKVQYFKCPYCRGSFAYKHDMLRHARDQHKNNKRRRPECSLEEWGYNEDIKTYEALQAKHKYLNCRYCQGHFAKKEDMLRHELEFHNSDMVEGPLPPPDPDCIPDVKKPFACQLCSKSYFMLSNYQRHINYHKAKGHTSREPLACCLCKTEVPDLQTLKKHTSTHWRDKIYGCHVCNRGYFWRKLWVNHLAKHEELDRQLLCEFCGIRIPDICALAAHTQLKHSKVLYVCFKCNKKLPNLSKFENHLKWHDRQKKMQRWMKHLKEAHCASGTQGCEKCTRAQRAKTQQTVSITTNF